MIDPCVFEHLDRALAGAECDAADDLELQFALVDVGRAIAVMDVEHEDAFFFVEKDYYQMVSAVMARPNRDGPDIPHFIKYLKQGMNRLKYGSISGPQLQRPKNQWEKMRDGEIILPGDPK